VTVAIEVQVPEQLDSCCRCWLVLLLQLLQLRVTAAAGGLTAAVVHQCGSSGSIRFVQVAVACDITADVTRLRPCREHDSADGSGEAAAAAACIDRRWQ
jgi:hypothetical protein